VSELPSAGAGTPQAVHLHRLTALTAVEEGVVRTAGMVDSMPAGFVSVDRQWRVTYANAEAYRLLGGTDVLQDLHGRLLWDLVPPAVRIELGSRHGAAATDGDLVVFDAWFPAPVDAWYEVRSWPGADVRCLHLVDVTERRSAVQRADVAAPRTALLARVTAELAGTLDTEEAVSRLARLVVPALGDWCAVTLVQDDGPGPPWQRMRDIGAWHTDPAKRDLVTRYATVRLASVTEGSFLARALSSGRPEVVHEDATARIAAVLGEGEARDLIRELAPDSAAFLPLLAHGRTLGLLSLFAGPGRGRLTARDLQIAGEVAGRAGLALDNARLYEGQRRLAEGLQRSLLTAPPEPDHLHVVVRYEPAAQVAQVGGDWYDAFLQADGSTVLVIGDVVGHDTQAAAAMGQLRGLLRGIAATTGEGPAQVLTRLDGAMELLQVGTTATAVVARLEQTDGERERGITRLRWSNAGHPPPIVILPDGMVTVLSSSAGVDADLLLGIDPGTPRAESQVVLDRESTVLLYTDGLVERREQSLDEGLSKLRAILTELADRPLGELCDEVLARMLPARAADDVALAAVRLYRQDRPRPVEAGPNRIPDTVDDDPALP